MNWTFSPAWTAAFVGAVFAVSFAGTGMILRLLRKRAILDHPNERSSHSMPTPKGAGLAVIPMIAAIWMGISWQGPYSEITQIVIAAALGLAVLSWVDDLKGLSPLFRLLGQAAAVAFVLMSISSGKPYFGGLLPGFADPLAAGLIWLWFVNLFNFMDGIDGIAGVEATAIGIGLALVGLVMDLSGPFSIYGLALAATALGFLCWNWHPAKIFLGDVGSVPLGFLLGWLLLGLMQEGLWAAALILPLYYFLDATITLLRRAYRGEKVWRAHRDHFYQQAVKRGLSHSRVVMHVLWVDGILIVLAIFASAGWTWVSLIGALGLVFWLLYFLGKDSREQT